MERTEFNKLAQDLVDKDLLIKALADVLECPVSKDIKDGWNSQHIAAHQRAEKLLKAIKEGE